MKIKLMIRLATQVFLIKSFMPKHMTQDGRFKAPNIASVVKNNETYLRNL